MDLNYYDQQCLKAEETSLRRHKLLQLVRTTTLRLMTRDVKGFVFVATTGRSGSHSLDRIFTAVDGAACFHEPYPEMYRTLSRDQDLADCFARRFVSLKNIYIREAARGKSWYMETNHQFIKNFADLAIREFGARIRIIHLVRDPVSVAMSFHRIDSIPGVTRRGRVWLLDPDAPDNLLPIPDILDHDPAFSDHLYRCLWYWYEIEARIEKLRRDWPGLNIPTVRTSDFNDSRKLQDMFRSLEIPVDEMRLAKLVGTRTNTKVTDNRPGVGPAQAEDMNLRLLEVIEARFGRQGGVGPEGITPAP